MKVGDKVPVGRISDEGIFWARVLGISVGVCTYTYVCNTKVTTILKFI